MTATVNSRTKIAGLLSTSEAAALAGLTAKQMHRWGPRLPATIDTAGEGDKGSARRWSPADVWCLAVMAAWLPLVAADHAPALATATFALPKPGPLRLPAAYVGLAPDREPTIGLMPPKGTGGVLVVPLQRAWVAYDTAREAAQRSRSSSKPGSNQQWLQRLVEKGSKDWTVFRSYADAPRPNVAASNGTMLLRRAARRIGVPITTEIRNHVVHVRIGEGPPRPAHRPRRPPSPKEPTT